MPLILTARMDEGAQSYFDELRQCHFPPERNQLSAHLTLFHALPGLEKGRIQAEIAHVASQQPIILGKATGVRSLGRGVAFTIDCGELVTVRSALADGWNAILAVQDQQGWRPHITVQNKVTPATAKGLLHQLAEGFQERPIQFVGLDLWHYCGGPWDLAETYFFLPGL